MRKRGYCLFICIILLVAMFIPLENVQAKAKPKLSVVLCQVLVQIKSGKFFNSVS